MLITRAAAVVLLTAALLTGTAADTPDGRPAPVQWRMAWSAPAEADLVNGTHGTPHYGVSQPALAMAAGQGTVRVHDARTGALVRTLSVAPTTPGNGSRDPVAGVWATSGTVVVFTDDQSRGDQRLHAYDARTGALLWRRAVTIASPRNQASDAGTYEGSPIMVTERGVVLVDQAAEPPALRTLDPRTGTPVARTARPRGCALTADATARSVVLLDHCAGNHLRLASVDPSTLRPNWTRTLPSPPRTLTDDGSPPSLHLVVSGDGYAGVSVGDVSSFYGPDGRLLSTGQEALRAAGSARDSRWSRPMRLNQGATTGGDGALWGDASRWPLPAFLVSVDAGSGRLRALPLDASSTHVSLVGTTPGMAFVLFATGRVAAYTLTYGVPGGHELFDRVPPDAWPDACGLLTAADLRPVADGYVPTPRTPTLFGERLPKPVQCDWIPPVDDAPVVSLSVDWVSSSSAVAAQIFATETARIKQTEIYDAITEDAYLLDYIRSTATGTGGAPEVLVNVGPVIVRLASASRSALRLLAPLVRDELLARYRLPRPVPTAPSNLRWTFPTDGQLRDDPVVAGGAVYAIAGGRVHAMDASSGRPLWTTVIAEFVGGPLRVTDGLVFVEGPGSFHALDARTGRRRWRHPVGPSSTFVVAKRRVILVDGETAVGLDTVSGRELWHFHSADTFSISRPVIDGATVYIDDAGGTVHALDVATGRRRWSVRTGAAKDGSHRATTAAAGKVVYVIGADRRLRALDAATGARRWNTLLGSPVAFPPVPAGDAVYAWGAAGVLYALDARTGRLRWAFAPGAVSFPAELAVDRGRVYLADGDGVLHCLDAVTGMEQWRQSVGADHVSGPIVHAGTVYAGAGGAVHALDGITGARKWRIRTGSQAPSVIAAGGLLYVSAGGDIHALRPTP
ncbi:MULTISPECIES: outer membrane protein assembly factor BamB family protein [Streptosporangium]|uniref:Outer membrane protein assembly factor BamB n=1 Tax=Streptosporangium brasiliense TaxID=47480 RepID=A0ABT9RGS5_9ACTN|nr:PQQ-binding-like beta-propeller repeat protein [Streptosporangium brasiliense]MDP9868472.1 outer membrane protein assembly factor BamB [Streptosporangium brasiliense]